MSMYIDSSRMDKFYGKNINFSSLYWETLKNNS